MPGDLHCQLTTSICRVVQRLEFSQLFRTRNDSLIMIEGHQTVFAVGLLTPSALGLGILLWRRFNKLELVKHVI